MSVIVLGTVALDTVKTPHGVRKNILGGSAVHFSMSCRMFTEVNLVAIVGRDFPRKHIEFLRGKGIILTSLVKAQGRTFQWSGEYKGDLNCALTKKTELGVLLTFCPAVSQAQRKIRNVFLANLDPEIQGRLLDCMDSPRLVALDSMDYWIQSKRGALLRLLKRVDIYVANDQEARAITGENNLIKAARSLRCLGPEMVLIKKGEHGVLFYCGKFIFSIPAYPVDRVVDPTGAGDTFAGGFMGYLSAKKKFNEENIKKAIVCGTVCASFNIERFGVERTARLGLRDLEKRLDKFTKIVSF